MLPYLCTDKRNETMYGINYTWDMKELLGEFFSFINNSNLPQGIKDGWNKLFIEEMGVQELHDEVVVFN